MADLRPTASRSEAQFAHQKMTTIMSYRPKMAQIAIAKFSSLPSSSLRDILRA
jgi:hypothetical protein